MDKEIKKQFELARINTSSDLFFLMALIVALNIGMSLFSRVIILIISILSFIYFGYKGNKFSEGINNGT
jgi:hypothetical protein